MLELRPLRAAVIRCFGQPRALDAFPSLGAAAARVANDELWLVGPRATGNELAERASSYLGGADPGGLVVDHGEAWAVWSVNGASSPAWFSRLASFPLPAGSPGFAQGSVVQVPAKIMIYGGRTDLIVPVQLGHHIPVRVLEACGDLGVTIAEERELTVERSVT